MIMVSALLKITTEPVLEKKVEESWVTRSKVAEEFKPVNYNE